MGILSISPMSDGTKIFFFVSFHLEKKQNKNYAIKNNTLKYVRS